MISYFFMYSLLLLFQNRTAVKRTKKEENEMNNPESKSFLLHMERKKVSETKEQ